MAGSNRAASCLTYGLNTCGDFVCGYDHGIGKLLEKAEINGELIYDQRKLNSTTIKMHPGLDKIVSKNVFSLYNTSLNDAVIEKLSQSGIVSKAVYLRPLMTLKMVT